MGKSTFLGGNSAVGKGLLTSVEVYDLREVSQRVNSTGKFVKTVRTNYSKVRKYVDISGGTNPTPPLARFPNSLLSP